MWRVTDRVIFAVVVAGCGHPAPVSRPTPPIVHQERLSAMCANGIVIDLELAITDRPVDPRRETADYAGLVLPAVRASVRAQVARLLLAEVEHTDRASLGHRIRDGATVALRGHGVSLSDVTVSNPILPEVLRRVEQERARANGTLVGPTGELGHLRADGRLELLTGADAGFVLEDDAVVIGDKRITTDGDRGVLLNGRPPPEGKTRIRVVGAHDTSTRRTALLVVAIAIAANSPGQVSMPP